MEQALWFVFGSVAGAALSKWGRPAVMTVMTAAFRAGDVVASTASRAGGAVASRTAEQRKNVSSFLAEAREKARAAKEAATTPQPRPKPSAS